MEESRHAVRPAAATPDLPEGERLAALQCEVDDLRQQLAARGRVDTSAPCASAALDPMLVAQVIDSVDTLVIIIDDQGRIVLFNRACEEIYGRSAASVQGRCVWELFERIGQGALARQAFEVLRAGGTFPDLERYAIERDNERYFIQWSTRLLTRGAQPPYIVITGVDVTRRRLAERALRLQVRFEQLIAQLSRQFIALTPENLDRGLTDALQAISELTKVERCSIWLLHNHDLTALQQCAWPPSTVVDRQRAEVAGEQLSWLLNAIGQREPVALNEVAGYERLADLGDPAALSAPAYLAAPLVCAGRTIGWLSLEAAEPRVWLDDLVALVKIVAELIANAIERVRADDALRAAESRWRKIIEGMPVMLWAVSARPDFNEDPPKIVFQAWNAECERVSGYSAEEIIGNPRVYELLAPDEDYYRRLAQEIEVLGTDFRDSHWLMRTKSGELRMIAWSNLAGRLPIPGWPEWGIGIDITAQYNAQQELIRARNDLEVRVEERTRELSAANDRLTREIENREVIQNALLHQTRILRAILNSIFDGVAVADQEGKFILFNKAAERILQVGAVDAAPTDWPRIYGLYLPDQQTPYPANDLPLMRATRGETVEAAEIYLARSDGPQGVWLSVNASPLEDERGELQGGVAVFRDVSETKRAHQELQAEQRLLQQLLRAHERDRQLLAYEIHDGLVQEMTGALMHLESYQGRRAAHPTAAEKDFQLCLRLMRRTIDEARRLISGLRPPILDEQGIAAAIEYLINEYRMRGAIEISFTHAIPTKHLDGLIEGTIYRILQEALSNVYRHSNATRAEVALAQKENWIQLQILDNGIGFDPQRVVENRYGLEGIRERARLLRGVARIESAPGQGTRVYVELPAMQRNVREGSQYEYSSVDR
jgi:PAS domain S-box-containing protein